MSCTVIFLILQLCPSSIIFIKFCWYNQPRAKQLYCNSLLFNVYFTWKSQSKCRRCSGQGRIFQEGELILSESPLIVVPWWVRHSQVLYCICCKCDLAQFFCRKQCCRTWAGVRVIMRPWLMVKMQPEKVLAKKGFQKKVPKINVVFLFFM
jgi:hypothetical protein